MILSDNTELIKAEDDSEDKRWERAVFERCRNRCANCGSEDRLRIRMVVPEAAGGKRTPSNGVLLCRTCEMSSESHSKASQEEERRLVNFWVSRGLFDRLERELKTHKGFCSMGAAVRYLIAKYIEDDLRFDDLELYQDEGSDTKINVWVDKDKYNVFKVLLDKKGLTITSAIKSLIGMYLLVGTGVASSVPTPQGDA